MTPPRPANLLLVDTAEAPLVATMTERHGADMIWDTDLFTEATDPDLVLAAAVETLGRTLGVSRAYFGEINAACDTIDIVMDWVDGVPSVRGRTAFQLHTPSVQQMLRDGITSVGDIDRIEIAPDWREALRADHTLAWICVPLMRGDRPAALIGISHHEPRDFTDADGELVREVGEKTWQALAHAHTLRRVRESQATLQHITERFEAEPDPDAMLYMAAETLGRAIGVTRAFYGEIDADADTIDIVMDWTNGIPSVRGKFPFSIHSQPVQHMLRTGATVVEDVDAVEMPDLLRQVNKANDTFAWIAVPLMRAGRPVALISVTNATPRSFTPTDVDLVREIGERTWQALVHAHTSRRLREKQAAMDAREQHERFFRALSDDIRDDRDDTTILFKIATTLADHLGAASAAFNEPDADDPMIHDIHHHVAKPAPHRTTRRVVLPAGARVDLDRLLDGQPSVSRDAATEFGSDLRQPLPGETVGSYITAPVVQDGRVAMLLSIQTDVPRDWSDADVRLVRDLADRAWSSVTRVRAAAALAEREAAQAFLIAWSDAVRDETDPERVIAETLDRLGTSFDPSAVTFSELDEAGAQLDHVRVWRDGATYRDTRSFPITAGGDVLARALLDQRSIAVDDVAADPRISADARAFFQQSEIAAVLVAPIVSRDRVVALLAMHADRPRSWSANEHGVLRDLADRVWSKIERTRSEIDLIRSRRALSQSEKMASMGAVLSGISHELNNPLAIVTAQAQLIAHIAEGTDLADRARRVHEAGDRCARIIRSFLAMARQTPPERRRAELSEIVEEAIRQVAPAMADGGVTLRAAVDPGLPDVLVDPDQIHQLIVNLLVNAQQAVAGLPENQRQITVRVSRSDDDVRVDVSDAGTGVPEAMRDQIFDPFFTTKPVGHGTGMGLALAQGLAELHGGTLTLVDSDRGATFRLQLPAA